jgi:hypothetical protein
LGLLDTAAISRPIVPAPGDYDNGEIVVMIGRGNRSTRRKPAPVALCPPQTPHACLDAIPGRRGGKPATNRLSYRTAYILHVTRRIGIAAKNALYKSNRDDETCILCPIY